MTVAEGTHEQPTRSTTTRSTTWPRAAIVGATLLGVYLLFVAVDARRNAHLSTGDTNNLVQGSRVLVDCLRARDFVGCGHYEGSVQTAIFPYPLLQYLPASLLVWLEQPDLDVLISLRWLSFMSVVAIVGLFGVAFWRRPRLLWLSWPVLIGSSLMYHANAGFGEALAAATLVCAVLAAAKQRPILVLLLACLASLGKETFGPFVAVLCLFCARDRDDRLLPSPRMTWAIIVGSVLGVAISLWFNVVRFGSPRNLLYLEDDLQTAGLVRKVEWLLALGFSPAGGVVWFWPGFAVVLITSVVVACRLPGNRQKLLALVPAGVLIALLGGLALWFAPFGWITFGPRLAVPMLPAVLFAMLWANGEAIVRTLSRKGVALGVVILVPLLSLPLFGAPWRWFDSVLEMIQPGADQCPAMTELSVYDDPSTYYRCTSDVMWRLRPLFLDNSVARGFELSAVASLLALIGSACLLAAALGMFGGDRSAIAADEAGPGDASDTPPSG